MHHAIKVLACPIAASMSTSTTKASECLETHYKWGGLELMVIKLGWPLVLRLL